MQNFRHRTRRPHIRRNPVVGDPLVAPIIEPIRQLIGPDVVKQVTNDLLEKGMVAAWRDGQPLVFGALAFLHIVGNWPQNLATKSQR